METASNFFERDNKECARHRCVKTDGGRRHRRIRSIGAVRRPTATAPGEPTMVFNGSQDINAHLATSE